MKKLFFLFTFFALYGIQNLAGQTQYKPGYIVTMENIEVSGFLNTDGWMKNPSSILFRESDTSRILVLHPSDVKAIKAGDDYYISATVDAETSPEDPDIMVDKFYESDPLHKRAFNYANNVSIEKIIPDREQFEVRSPANTIIIEPENISVSVFLKTLVAGQLNLFYFVDENSKEHYYISNTPGVYEELYRIFFIDETQTVQIIIYELDYFRRVLARYMVADKSFEKRMLQMNFSKQNLIDLVAKYNVRYYIESGTTVMDEDHTIYNYGIVIRSGFTDLTFTGQYGFQDLVSVSFNNEPNYFAGADLEIVPSGLSGLFSLYNELGFGWGDYDGSGYRTVLLSDTIFSSSEFEILYLRATTMIRFRLSKGTFKPFISSGFGFSALLKIDNQITTDHNGYIESYPALDDPKRMEQYFCMGIGFVYKNISFELRGEKGNGYSSYMALKSGTTSANFIVCYHF